MVNRACPLPKEEQPPKCEFCPYKNPEERKRKCNWFKGMVRSRTGFWKSDREKGYSNTI